MGPIVGIGELLWDVYPDGRKVAGGAPFNFAFHCHQLGHEAVIVSRVGNDDLGKELREEVKQLGMSDEFIQTDEEHPTGTVKVTVDEKGQPRYVIADNVAWDHLEWQESIFKIRKKMSVCCYGSLASRNAKTREFVERFFSVWDAGVEPDLIVWDVNVREPYFKMRELFDCDFLGCDWLKINEDELLRFIPEANAEDYGYFVRHTFSNNVIILTLGSRGCMIIDQYDDILIPAVPISTFDTVGAGDAFTAAMVVMHLEGRPLRECARFANHYAAKVCEHRGATPKIDRREVELAAFGK